MSKGKFQKRSAFPKGLAVLLALTLLVGAAVGGTVAWLTSTTNEVTNTFTTSDISITLEETGIDTNGDKSYKMVPGHTHSKNPKVTVAAGSEDCYVFVEVNKSATFDTYMASAIDAEWTLLKDNIYYMIFTADSGNTKGTAYSILGAGSYVVDEENNIKLEWDKDEVVTRHDVTKAMMEAVKDENPTISFKAYAIQYWKDQETPFTLTEAWALAKPANP